MSSHFESKNKFVSVKLRALEAEPLFSGTVEQDRLPQFRIADEISGYEFK